MPPLFRRPSLHVCFFCQSSAPKIFNPRHFRCQICQCWNRYDDHGEIMSDEPAMHDEALNVSSFGKRASPRRDRLPTTIGKGPFCHVCQTNQMLLINLLSNYLPSPNNPDYQRRVEALPEYRASLETRYPPVCSNCQLAVEEEIQKKNNMARTQALGGWLKVTKGNDRNRRIATEQKIPERKLMYTLAWKIRGYLWGLNLATSLIITGLTASGLELLSTLSPVLPVLPAIVLISIFWTFWDPTYPKVRRARLQGRDVRLQGRGKYIALQATIWVYRLLTSLLLSPWSARLHLSALTLWLDSQKCLYFSTFFVTEITAFFLSFLVLQIQHPPAIRLIDTHTHSSTRSRDVTPFPGRQSVTPQPGRNSQPLNEADIMASLTLSSNPVFTAPLPPPKFGVPSLAPAPRVDDADSMAMDWDPTEPAETIQNDKEDTSGASSWLRPQRFFGPESPTGLESLLERTSIDDSNGMGGNSGRRPRISKFVGEKIRGFYGLFS